MRRLLVTLALFIPLALAQITAIEGTALDRNGKPLADAPVLIRRTDIKGNYPTKADRRGHFLFVGLPLGAYTVCILGVGDKCVSRVVDVRTSFGNPTQVVLTLGGPPAPPPLISEPGPNVPPPDRGVSAAAPPTIPSAITQRAALVIGNNSYASLPALRTATADAQAVAAELSTRYGFAVTLLTNARREQILSALNRYRRELPNSSQLLIYYAGHGYYDKAVDKAYWLPVDASPNDNTAWISADDITTDLKGMAARQILIVSDSCYSGGLTRSAPISLTNTADRDAALTKLEQRASRLVMSSGGNEPVADGGGGTHSVFAAAFLAGLEQMEQRRFTVEELFASYIREPVAGRSNQSPELSPLRNSGHEGGSFVFVQRIIIRPIQRRAPQLRRFRRRFIRRQSAQPAKIAFTHSSPGGTP